jgi:hypothetical protein
MTAVWYSVAIRVGTPSLFERERECDAAVLPAHRVPEAPVINNGTSTTWPINSTFYFKTNHTYDHTYIHHTRQLGLSLVLRILLRTMDSDRASEL